MKLNLNLNPRANHNRRGGVAFHRRRSPATSSAFRPVAAPNSFREMLLPDSISSSLLLRRILIATVFLFGVSLSCYVLFRAADSVGFRLPDSLDPSSSGFFYVFPSSATDIIPPSPVSSRSIEHLNHTGPLCFVQLVYELLLFVCFYLKICRRNYNYFLC